MIQFINALGVTCGIRGKYLNDSVEAILIPIHRIVSFGQISHIALRNMQKCITDGDEDIVQEQWTVVHWEGTEHTLTAYLRHDLDRVMRAIAYLNNRQDRTTCYVDDFSEKNMG